MTVDAARIVPRPHRQAFVVVHDWAGVAEHVRKHAPEVVIADVDPAVAGYGAEAPAVRRGFAAAEDELKPALAENATLVWATNSTRVADGFGEPPQHTPGGNPLIFGARKPLLATLTDRIGELRGRSVVVVGDQWLTDGLLAWRLGAVFLLWVPSKPRPLQANVKYAPGKLVARALFHRVS